jgi:hypothetical protein
MANFESQVAATERIKEKIMTKIENKMKNNREEGEAETPVLDK